MTTCIDAVFLERIGNGTNVCVEAALGKTRARGEAADKRACETGKKISRKQRNGHPRDAANGDECKKRRNAEHAPASGREFMAVPDTLAACYQHSDPAYGMADPTI